MKEILITGINSYVGNSLADWLDKDSDSYSAHRFSLRNDKWNEIDFSKYEVVVHVAGIAHVSSDPKMEDLYYKINRDLTIDIAKKAKAEGVKQFIFMSSIIVYGDSSSTVRIIDINTPPSPSNFYGNSKLQAEEGIKPLETDTFKIVIIRPPMIYGKGSKGNYRKLAELARRLPIFPKIDNQRSMLHIDNLCELIRLIIVNQESGTFYPQNSEYVNTSDMVKMIAEAQGKTVVLIRLFNPIIKILGRKLSMINKIFGNLVYDKRLSEYKHNYQIRDLRKTIELTELESR